MRPQTLAVRLLPMVLNAFASAAQGVLLPQIILTYGLTLSDGGYLVGAMQGAGIVSMVIAGMWLDRKGAVTILMISLAISTVGAAFVGVASTFFIASAALILFSMSMTALATSTNALMAQTGSRRAYYLGMMHATYSFLSITAPLAAGVIVAHGPWHHYYLWLALLSLAILLISWKTKDDRRADVRGADDHSASKMDSRTKVDDESISQGPVWWRMSALWGIGLGVFFMVGSQATVASWAYSFMAEVYDASHSVATAATSLFWVGILVGRVSAIWLSSQYSEHRLLLVGCLLGLIGLLASWVTGWTWLMLLALVVFGYGLSGAFQLGTAWAVSLIPHRVGIASSLVMTVAAAGGLIFPTLTALLAHDYTFNSMRIVLAVGFAVSALSFAAARTASGSVTSPPSYSNRSARA